jgi:hypothetical protein
MRIVAPAHPKAPQDIYEPLEDAEDYEYLVMVGAGLLEGAGYLFEMEGFGRAWNLDVAYDMSAFMESLPSFLAKFRSEGKGEIDLYPQGVERLLTFSREGELVKIEFLSAADRTSNLGLETCDRIALDLMFTDLAINFARGLKDISSPIGDLSPFVEWRAGAI